MSSQIEQQLARRLLARRHLLPFTTLTHSAYQAGWVHADICRRLEQFSEDVANKRSPRLMILVPPRHGKLLADDTEVLTRADGWKWHGDLVKGDEVLGMNGWTKVVGVSSPGEATLELRTNAGTRIACHPQHEWWCEVYGSFEPPGNVRNRKGMVVEAADILAYQKRRGDLHAAGATMRRFYLPHVERVPLEAMPAYSRRRTSGNAQLAFVEVLEMPPKPGRCIQVAADDGMYLVTRDFVPTHNSELASVRFPAWHLGQYPEHEIIDVGYNLELPMTFSRRVRELVRTPEYQALFPAMQLDASSQSVEAWLTTRGGGFTAAGVGGGIVGKGCAREDTPILCPTSSGGVERRPVSEVCVGDRVYGYDERQRCAVITTVRGVQASVYRGELHDYGPEGGFTPDHRFFNASTGAYTPAEPGMPILRFEEGQVVRSVLRMLQGSGVQAVSGLSAVRGEEGADCHDLPRVPPGGTEHVGHVPLRAVRSGRITHGGGDEESPSERVLFPGLLQGLQELASRARADFGRMRGLRYAVIRATKAAKVLFARVLGAWSEARDWTACRGLVPVGLLLGTAGSHGARRAQVSDVWGNGGLGAASHRRKSNEQHIHQLDNSVPEMPRAVSSRPGANARAVGRDFELYGRGGAVVVDLQTDTGNFFSAVGLVHNCHILIVDDPIKNQEEADSMMVRDKLYTWFQTAAYTRLAPGAGVLCIETYWSFDDLAGRLQARMENDPDADQYVVVKYPALSEAWEYQDKRTKELVRSPTAMADKHLKLLRPPGTCLHEARYPTAALQKIRANVAPRVWSALYQQNPVPEEGAYFKAEYLRRQPAMPRSEGMFLCTAWDFAIGMKQSNDWNVGATLLQDETDTLYVLEVLRFRGDSFVIVDAMLDAALRWGQNGANYVIGAEDGQIWRALEPLLKRRMTERRQYVSYQVMKPMTDKLARARPLQGRMQQGRVVFPEGAGWMTEVEIELLRFPTGAHDDIVDALAWGAQLCLGREPPRLPVAPPPKSWRDKLVGQGDGTFMAA